MSETIMTEPEFDSQHVLIEPALPEDAEAICDIRDRARIKTYPNAELGITPEDVRINAQGLNGEFVPRRVAHLKNRLAVANRPDGSTYVAKVGGKVVGFVDPSIEDGKRRIGALYVDPDFQNMGIGSMLIKQALAWHGNNDIYLEVVAYNQNAINFYKNFGFSMTDTVVQEEPGRPAYMKSIPAFEMVRKAKD